MSWLSVRPTASVDVSLKRGRSGPWWTAAIVLIVLTVGVALSLFVSRATTQMREALAEEVLEQQRDVATLLHEYAGVIIALERGRARGSGTPGYAIEVALIAAQAKLEKMRSHYSFARLDGAAEAHAFVKPILEDVDQWLKRGLPGYPPGSPMVSDMAAKRIGDRYPALRLIAANTDAVATSLISAQTRDLDSFRDSLIMLLGGFAILSLSIALLLIRQRNLQAQLVDDQERHAQRFKDFADTGADWLWEMDSKFRLQILSGPARGEPSG